MSREETRTEIREMIRRTPTIPGFPPPFPPVPARFQLRSADGRVIDSGDDPAGLKRLGGDLRKRGMRGLILATAEGAEVCSWL